MPELDYETKKNPKPNQAQQGFDPKNPRKLHFDPKNPLPTPKPAFQTAPKKAPAPAASGLVLSKADALAMVKKAEQRAKAGRRNFIGALGGFRMPKGMMLEMTMKSGFMSLMLARLLGGIGFAIGSYLAQRNSASAVSAPIMRAVVLPKAPQLAPKPAPASKKRNPTMEASGGSSGAGKAPRPAEKPDDALAPSPRPKSRAAIERANGHEIARQAKADYGDEMLFANVATIISGKPGSGGMNLREDPAVLESIAAYDEKNGTAFAEFFAETSPTGKENKELRELYEATVSHNGGSAASKHVIGSLMVPTLTATSDSWKKKREEERKANLLAGGPSPDATLADTETGGKAPRPKISGPGGAHGQDEEETYTPPVYGMR